METEKVVPWEPFRLALPPELSEITKDLTTGLEAAKSALQIAQTVIRLTQSLVLPTTNQSVELANRAISAAIGLIQSALNSLLDRAGGYVLLVPLPKKGLLGVATSVDDPDEPGSNYVEFPDKAMLSLLSATVAESVRASPSFASIFDAPTFSLGGNRYLVNTIAGAMYDPGDKNRPRFTGESYWAYALLVAGATDVSSILGSVVSLDRLFSWPRNANGVTPSRGIADFVPASVSARPSGRENFAVVEWHHVPPASPLFGYDQGTVSARQYAVIRSKDLRAKTVARVLDLFSTDALREGLTGVYGSRVLKVADYDGVVSRYVDTDRLTAGETYYYHVVFSTKIVGGPISADSGINRPRTTASIDPSVPEPRVYEYPFDVLSSAAEWTPPTTRAQLTDTQLSRAPDWSRTPSVAGLIPGLDRIVDIVNEQLSLLQAQSQGYSARSQQYLNTITQQVSRISANIDGLNNALTRINNVFKSADGGIYGTVRAGRGDAPSFLADVIQAIDDPTDPNHPPFDVGDEYVAAALLLVVSPDAALVTAAVELFKLLFGGEEANPALAGIESITTTLAEAEQALIDQIQGGGTTPADAPVAFSEDMQPRPLGEADASCG